jgi:hypothetical protein
VDSLREIGATIIGVVINGVEERDTYGYGSYRYSDYRYYYKNYNYKYGYGYGKYGGYNAYAKDGGEYYADENPRGTSRKSAISLSDGEVLKPEVKENA